MSSYNLTHLIQLEHEAVFVLREVAAQFERPVLLFSGGKDSLLMVRLAQKAFWPGRSRFRCCTWIPVTISGDDRISRRVRQPDRRASDRAESRGFHQGRSRGGGTRRQPEPERLQTVTLLDAIEEFKFDAALGGARRDKEKARAKERFFSYRDEFGQWDPKNQRPELWNLFNGRKHPGEHFRIFPLSNWTEMDVWQYIAQEQIEIPSIYFPTAGSGPPGWGAPRRNRRF